MCVIKSTDFRKPSLVISIPLRLSFRLFFRPSFIPQRESISGKCAKDTWSEAMFAISSAIPPGQELLGVRHAASGSAATNPGGTIKLHLNNVSGRAWATRGTRGKRERAKGTGETRPARAASLQKKPGSGTDAGWRRGDRGEGT